MVKAMKAVQKAKAKKHVVISVSQGFVNVGTGERVYLVSFQSLRNVFYLKAEHFKSLLEMALQKRKALKPSEDGTWIQTVDYYKLRSKEYGDDSIWFRSEKRKTQWTSCTLSTKFRCMMRSRLRASLIGRSSIFLM